MRAALIALLAAAGPAATGVPLALAERQVVTLEFQEPVARIATTDPDLLNIRTAETRVTVTALRGGRATLEVTFVDGAKVVYEITVDAARHAAVRAAGPSELEVGAGEERRFRAPGVVRVLVEENGVARVEVAGETVSVAGLARGQASLVLVDAAGGKTSWLIRVR